MYCLFLVDVLIYKNMSKKKEENFASIYHEYSVLNQKYSELLESDGKLVEENKKLRLLSSEMTKKLKSKRYLLVDFLIDGAYSLLRKKNPKKEIIKKGNDLTNRQSFAKCQSKKVKSTDLGTKRKFIPKKVDIINMNFYDWEGKVLYKGGAERYVFDLACVLKKMGYKTRILQCSYQPFVKTYRGIEIVGVGSGNKNDIRECSRMYNFYCADCEFVIASPFKLACEIDSVPVIGINHGIDFDCDETKYVFGWGTHRDEEIEALKKVTRCVCVDTNFINWTRTQEYSLSLKERYIPNYCETALFENNKKERRDDDPVVFLYPRRIYNARGADITIRAFNRLLSKYHDKMVIRFVGQIDNDAIGKKLKALMEKFPNNVFRYEYDMKDMVKAYAGVDVALIPTRYSEGTSLSCIESMASGCAVIATDVGGLPNLVIDGYNGRLVSPTTDSLCGAITEMVENPKLREEMADNARSVAKMAFDKKMWDQRWREEIEHMATLTSR